MRGAAARTRQAGFSYLEALLAVLMVGLLLLPALDAIDGGVKGAAANAATAGRHFGLVGKLEEVLALPYAALDAEALAAGGATVATAYSDAPGTPERRVVHLARWDVDNADADGNPLTGGDDGLLWLQVRTEDGVLRLETLTAR